MADTYFTACECGEDFVNEMARREPSITHATDVTPTSGTRFVKGIAFGRWCS